MIKSYDNIIMFRYGLPNHNNNSAELILPEHFQNITGSHGLRLVPIHQGIKLELSPSTIQLMLLWFFSLCYCVKLALLQNIPLVNFIVIS